MAPAVQGRKETIIGASGKLGKPTIDALVGLGAHTITAIQRPASMSRKATLKMKPSSLGFSKAKTPSS